MAELNTNVISEWMYAHCYKEGNDMLLLDYFFYYRNMNRSLSLQDQQLTVNGKPCMKLSTAVWDILFLWKDESTIWEKLSDLKECHPVEVDEYSVLQRMDHQPSFI